MASVEKVAPLPVSGKERGNSPGGCEAEEHNVGTIVEIDPVAEKKLVRRLDTHLIPTVMLLYLFSFLDR